ncbi:MAG: type III-A CRISPR-associated RAMP protein Csm5 [Anaerolineae bacterium]
MADYTLYRAKVTLLTPLHIGSGETLLHRYDYAIHDRRTWRLDGDAILDAQNLDDPALVARLAATPPADLLDRSRDYVPDNGLFRYVINGTPRSRAEGAQLIEQIKNACDRPYLPGTSLKGALRTALLWEAWERRGLQPAMNQLNRSGRFAAQRYERDLLGRNPNQDLLRALHVSDSASVGADALMVANAQVIHQSGDLASPIEMEALKPDTVLELTLKVDDALFSAWAERAHLRGRTLLEHLPQVVQRHTAQRVETEMAWFKEVRSARAIYDFYRQLPTSGLPDHLCLLQVGWGTGWDDKTFGSRLRADPRFMEDVISRYKLARRPRERGDPFPKSRRVLVGVHQTHDGRRLERPQSTVGWVLLELSKA